MKDAKVCQRCKELKEDVEARYRMDDAQRVIKDMLCEKCLDKSQ